MPGKNPINKNNNGDGKNVKAAEKEEILRAHEQAEHDIEKDPELSTEPEKGDDLDEGELAQLDNNV